MLRRCCQTSPNNHLKQYSLLLTFKGAYRSPSRPRRVPQTTHLTPLSGSPLSRSGTTARSSVRRDDSVVNHHDRPNESPNASHDVWKLREFLRTVATTPHRRNEQHCSWSSTGYERGVMLSATEHRYPRKAKLVHSPPNHFDYLATHWLRFLCRKPIELYCDATCCRLAGGGTGERLLRLL